MIVHIEMVLLDVADHAIREQIMHGHAATQKHPDLRRRHVVVDHLPEYVDVRPP